MNIPRLLRTTAARLVLRYALLYAALMAVGLGLLYWSTGRFVDAQLRAGLEQALEGLVRTEHDQGRPELRAHIDADLRFAGKSGLHLLLIDAHGRAVAGDLRRWPPDLPADGHVHNVSFDDDLLTDRGGDEDGYWPALGVRFGDGARLLVARGVDEADALRDFTQGTMAAILAVSVALTVALGWLQGRTLLQRVDALSATARAVGAGRLSRRVPLSGRDDEFDDLAGQLNTMLDRIEQLLAGMRQVTDNVAHDMRRPLSRMRNRLDVTLLEARSEEEYREAIERATGDLDEIIRTFNALLEIAQAEAGSFRGDWGPVDLEPLIAELGALYGDIAGEQGKQLDIDLGPGLQVTGNRHLLGQAVSNLLDNAVKFAPTSTRIRLEGRRDAGRIRLAVRDRGPGIPADQRARVLERFVRLDPERSTPGSGLGLSLVAAAARLHGGTLTLGEAEPGLVVALEFPAEGSS
jgi:signal transduction histidine kinase